MTGIEIQPHHTAEFYESIPRRLEEFVVKAVDDTGGDRVSLTAESGWGWAPLKSDLGREIHVGERLQQETIRMTQVTGVRDVNGWLFRRTNQELADEAREFSEGLHRREVEQLERNRKEWAAQEAALPDWLKARIQRFRDAAGEQFLLSGWGYELMICRLADLMDRGLETDADQLASDEGASGNQWNCAESLAAGRARHGDEIATVLPAGLAPITGSADYS